MAKKKCKAGDLRHRLVIEKPVLVTNDTGGQDETWETFTQVWGSLNPLSAFQKEHASTLEHRVTHKSKIRFLTGITSDMRINFRGRIFQIHGIKDIEERNIFLEILSEEGAAS